jgi:2-dehydropantoate 2-reductase
MAEIRPPPARMSLSRESRIVIAGAGSVGCYLGGRLALAGRGVTLLLRDRLKNAIALNGMRVSDLDGAEATVPPTSLRLSTDPAEALANAELVLVTVKSRDTAEIANAIAEHAPNTAVVVSLQNGVDNLSALFEALPGRRIVGGMVPFNVVQSLSNSAPARFHRASSGTIRVGQGVEGLADLLNVEGSSVAEHPDIGALLWGKLVINLNNALNALSGLPLVAELSDRRWRLLFVGQMREALAVLKAAGIRTAPVEGVPLRAVAFALGRRNLVFKLLARRMLAVDPKGRSSMWEDLEARRPTEIDYIQGKFVALAEKLARPAPLLRRVLLQVKQAERAGKGSPHLAPEQVAGPEN